MSSCVIAVKTLGFKVLVRRTKTAILVNYTPFDNLWWLISQSLNLTSHIFDNCVEFADLLIVASFHTLIVFTKLFAEIKCRFKLGSQLVFIWVCLLISLTTHPLNHGILLLDCELERINFGFQQAYCLGMFTSEGSDHCLVLFVD